MAPKKLSPLLCALLLCALPLSGCGSTSGHYVPSQSPDAAPTVSAPDPTPAPTPTPRT